MITHKKFVERFQEIQTVIVPITRQLATEIAPGMSELEIADRYRSLLARAGFSEHWYPILVCVGPNTGKPLSRRFHLPSAGDRVKKDDIIILDCTPIDGHVWGNWSESFAVGNSELYRSLIRDGESVAEKTAEYAKTEATTVGQVFDYCMSLIESSGLILLDPRNDVGHSIFPVPIGQTVELTPLTDRLFISEEYRDTVLSGVISIEPQVGRIDPLDGKMYGVKFQRVVVYPPSALRSGDLDD